MTVYATAAEMTARLSSGVMLLIADDDDDEVVDTVAVVDPALSAASSFADTFLTAYLPITTVPDVLRDAVIDITAQNLRLPRGIGTDDSKLMYDNAVRWLTRVADGTAVLPGASDDGEDPGEPEMFANDRAWTRTLSRGVF